MDLIFFIETKGPVGAGAGKKFKLRLIVNLFNVKRMIDIPYPPAFADNARRKC